MSGMMAARAESQARTGKAPVSGRFFYFSYYYFTAVCPVAGEV
jgi:hypothetical protein